MRGKDGGTTPLHHPAADFLRKLDVESLVQRVQISAPELLAVRMELPSGKTGVPARTSYWVAGMGVTEDITVPCMLKTSAKHYKDVSFIERDVVAFLKENHYGEFFRFYSGITVYS